jgi:hypothetical protein
MPDEVARIGALSNGSNGQRSLESASLHFEPVCRREGGAADREPAGEILSAGFARRISVSSGTAGVSDATQSGSRHRNP